MSRGTTLPGNTLPATNAPMAWTQLRVVTPQANAELCAQLLLDAGCAGVQIDDCEVLFDESEDTTVVNRADAAVLGYAVAGREAAATTARLQEALSHAGMPGRLDSAAVPEQDWSTVWREHFTPLRIGRFLIVPPWDDAADAAGDAGSGDVGPDVGRGQSAEAPAGDELASGEAMVICIDPGLAFGTGQHPTTRLCLELLEEALAGSAAERVAATAATAPPEAAPPVRLLDAGCGSGILSIAAARLGARVTASDPDPFCVQATRGNARANGVPVNLVQAAGLEWIGTEFDLVVANLMSALLISLARPLAAVTRPGGTLIVSGISAPRASEVEAALCSAGFTTVCRRLQDGEARGDFIERWAALLLRRDVAGAASR